MVVDVVVQNPQKSNEYEYEKNMYVVTPRYAAAAAAAVVSAVALRRPTKEYTHPYSMMHRRLPIAGIEVAPHYDQLLVKYIPCTSMYEYEIRHAMYAAYKNGRMVVAGGRPNVAIESAVARCQLRYHGPFFTDSSPLFHMRNKQKRKQHRRIFEA